MTLRRSISRSAAWAGLMLLAGAVGVSAQERPLFEWRGRVDREVELYIRDGSVQQRGASWKERVLGGGERLRVFNALPHDEGRIFVRRQDGRGDVDVVQQPSRRNDYVAVIRIRDDPSGADNYRLQVSWRPDRAGWGNDRGRDRDRDGDDRGNGGWNGGSNGGWNRGNGAGGWDRGNGSYGGPGMLRWSGMVDDEAEIRIQGRRVESSNVRGDGTRDVRSDLSGELPRRDVRVSVDDRGGRGRVTVIQQPSAWNGYMAIIRVRDPQSGYGRYSFDVRW